MKSLLIASLSLISLSANSATWDLNDVSYLLPLPTSSTDATYLRIKDFIPSTWFTQTLADAHKLPYTIEVLRGDTSTDDRYRTAATASFNSIHLLAVRLDPCFKDLFSDVCRPQLRAVWQPIDKKFSSADATVHTFYDFTPTEFRSIADRLLQLKTKYKIKTGGLALQIHPGFKQNGFAKEFSAFLKTWLQQDHLTRIAFMKLLGAEFQWRFQSFDVKEGKLIPIVIPIHSGTLQTFAIHGNRVPPGTLELSEEDHTRMRNGEFQDQVLLDYALRVENPRINIPGTTDCLSCHAAGGLKGPATRLLHLNEIPTVAAKVGLIGQYNLQNGTKNRDDALHFRAFGYVFKDPSISDRVIIESALVADELNR